MSPSLVDHVAEALLGPGIKQVVPLVCLCDDTDFAREAASMLKKVGRRELNKVIHLDSTASAAVKLDTIFTAGYREQIAPFTLWDTQPTWCVWLLGNDPDFGALAKSVSTLDKTRPGRLQHFFILKPKAAFRGGSGLRQLSAKSNGVLCVLANEGELKRSDRQLAQAVAAWIYSGWKRFCAAAQASFHTALWLPPDSPVVTLGIGHCEVDVRYHAQRWSRRLAEMLCARWSEPMAEENSSSLPSLRDLAAMLLPPEHYWMEGESGPHGTPNLRMESESVSLRCRDLALLPATRPRSSHLTYLDHLLTLRNKYFAFLFLRGGHTRWFIQLWTPAVRDKLDNEVRAALVLPEKPGSLFQYLRRRLNSAIAYARRLQSASAESDAGSDFSTDFKETQRAISVLPSLRGLSLRCALILVGLAWLVIGPLVWAGPGQFLSDPWLHAVSLYAAACAVLVLCAGLLTLAWCHARVWRHLDQTESNLRRGHLSEVSREVAATIQGQGAALLEKVTAWQQELEVLVKEITRPSEPSATQVTNQHPFLDDQCVDAILRPRETELADSAHKATSASLATKGWPNFSVSLWRQSLMDAARSTAASALANLDFETCVRAKNPTPGQRTAFLKNLIHEARQPAWPLPGATPFVTICFGDPAWSANCAEHDTVEHVQMNCPAMLVVSTMPLPVAD